MRNRYDSGSRVSKDKILLFFLCVLCEKKKFSYFMLRVLDPHG